MANFEQPQISSIDSLRDLLEKNVESEYQKLQGNKPNVLVVGRTGTGKSSLINAIFGDQVAKVGAGTPVTQSYTAYTSDQLLVNLYDSMGWEGGADGEKRFFADTHDFLKQHRTSNPDDHIHVVWYTLDAPSARFTDFDLELLTRAIENLPIVIILTKCDIASDEQIDAVKQAIEKANIPGLVTILEVSAAPLKRRGQAVSEVYGLKELVAVTEKVLPEARQAAFIAAQIVDLGAKASRSRNTILAAVGTNFAVGFTPIPFSDWMALAPIQSAMLGSIAVIYGIKPATAKATLSTAGGFASIYIATVNGIRLAAGLMKFVPGIGTVAGGIINGTVAASMTASMGFSFRALFHEMLRLEITGQGNIINPEWMAEFLDKMLKETWKNLKTTTDFKNYENIKP